MSIENINKTQESAESSTRVLAFKVSKLSAPVNYRDYVKFESGSDSRVIKCPKAQAFGQSRTRKVSKVGDDVTVIYLYGGSSGSSVAGLALNALSLDMTLDDGTVLSADMSNLLDDTNLSRVVSGSIVGTDFIFVRDDASTLTVDATALLDNTNLSKIVSASFDVATKTLNLTRDDASVVSVVFPNDHIHANQSELDLITDGDHDVRIDNPHVVTKAQVGLGNVDNTSDLNKPLSTLAQNALDTKVDKVAGKGLSSEDYTLLEKNKLAGIEPLAEVNVNPDWNQTVPTEDSFIKNKPHIHSTTCFKYESGSSTDYFLTGLSAIFSGGYPSTLKIWGLKINGVNYAAGTQIIYNNNGAPIPSTFQSVADEVALILDAQGVTYTNVEFYLDLTAVGGDRFVLKITTTDASIQNADIQFREFRGSSSVNDLPLYKTGPFGSSEFYKESILDGVVSWFKFNAATGVYNSIAVPPSQTGMTITDQVCSHIHKQSDIENLETDQTIQDNAIALNTAKISFVDAPNDGAEYVRKNLAWAETLHTLTAPVDSVNGKVGVVVLDKTDIGLGNVDNTSDADKPVSTATQTALDLKADQLTTYTKTEVDTSQAVQNAVIAINTLKISSLRGEPIADNAALTALPARDYERRKVLSTGNEYVFVLGAAQTSPSDIADNLSTGYWQLKPPTTIGISARVGEFIHLKSGSKSTTQGYLEVNPGTVVNGATTYPVWAALYPEFVSGADIVFPANVGGMFLRNLGGAAGVEGAYQASGNKSHTHGFKTWTNTTGNAFPGVQGVSAGSFSVVDIPSGNNQGVQPEGVSEARPNNRAYQLYTIIDSYAGVIAPSATTVAQDLNSPNSSDALSTVGVQNALNLKADQVAIVAANANIGINAGAIITEATARANADTTLQLHLDNKAPLIHTHLEADITNLDKYTQAQVDASQAVQDTNIQNNTDETEKLFKNVWSNRNMQLPENITWNANKLSFTGRIIWLPFGVVGSNHVSLTTVTDLTVSAWQVAYINLSDAEMDSGNPSKTQADIVVASYATYAPSKNHLIIGVNNGDTKRFCFANGLTTREACKNKTYIHTKTATQNLGSGNAQLIYTSPVMTIQSFKKIKMRLRAPLRSAATSWGGAYLNVNVNVNGTWYNLGNGGYDGNVMSSNNSAIATWLDIREFDFINSLSLNKENSYTLQMEITGRSYNGNTILNGSHDLNKVSSGLNSRGALQTWATNQNYFTITLEESEI